ncbi:MAG: 4-alpha-glucanotransferase [Muribaculaceae bacterium]|nr:4-alpha-glucanotransferase [Muribaculaceae bacterium]
MKLIFNINYRTNWGEAMYMLGNITQKDTQPDLIAMSIKGNDTWCAIVEIPENTTVDIEYRYIVKSENAVERHEWGKPHKLLANAGVKDCIVYDRWQDQPYNKHYFSSAFIDGIFHRETSTKKLEVKPNNLLLSVTAPHISPNECLAISGNNNELGNWDPDKAILLNDSLFPIWQVNIPLEKITDKFNYKFLIKDKETGRVIAWEKNNNREFDIATILNNDSIVLNQNFIDPCYNWKGAGTAIPVFSLRSEDDFGAGDFYDLFKMIDWVVETGQNFVQILPINDTTMTHTWTDSYPYNANSTFALHPMYLRLDAIGTLSDSEKMKEYKSIAKELNSLAEVDYERVTSTKSQYVKEIFSEIGASVAKQKAYKSFIESNKYWLTDYASFCVLRDIYKTPDFTQWGEYKEYSKAKIEAIIKKYKKEIELIYFTQYFLDKQLTEVRDYAHKMGVVLKGDIPIGISRTSADAWVNPKLFNMDSQAGAPPDDFSVLGQNWGFPTYNWEEMSKDGFSWWRSRFIKMSEYFDAYRIDHILGFFRIWQIPMDAVHGLLGIFNPALPYSTDELKHQYDFWIDHNLHTTPYIMDYFLTDFFGEYLHEVKGAYLDSLGYGRYQLKTEFNTQKKIAEYFVGIEKTDKNDKIKEALLGLVDQVLFIEDPIKKGHYHPRISAQFTYIYRSLNDYERWCYDRLYNDFFYHRHNDFWYGKAMWKLPPLINATDMLVCGEDLGMIPDCVSAVMDSQQILSLEIQRMPKDPKAEFGYTGSYPYLSVGTTSTHDMGGIRSWWEEDRTKTQHFYNNMLHEGGTAPYYAEPWICDKIVSLHLNSPSMLTILPLQDWLSIDGTLRRENPKEEQINVPANSRHYWRYRMHLTLEKLNKESTFNKTLKEKIKNSGR